MIEFPLGFYYRPDPWTFIVSPDPIEGFQPSPACDLGNGTILSSFRLSEFDLCNVSSVPRSIPGYKPWTNVDAQTLKNSLKAKGQYLETFGAWCWINFLRLIKQQNLNSQKVNGMGINSGDNASIIIIEDNIKGIDGYISLDANDNVRTLGLQNFYSRLFDFLHNAMIRSASKVWIKKDFINADIWPTYSDAISSGWEELDITLTGNGYISELAWNSNESWALYPSKIGGNNIEPIGDYCSIAANNPFSVVAVGGDNEEGFHIGSLYLYSYNKLSHSSVHFGGRSLEIVL